MAMLDVALLLEEGAHLERGSLHAVSEFLAAYRAGFAQLARAQRAG